MNTLEKAYLALLKSKMSLTIILIGGIISFLNLVIGLVGIFLGFIYLIFQIADNDFGFETEDEFDLVDEEKSTSASTSLEDLRASKSDSDTHYITCHECTHINLSTQDECEECGSDLELSVDDVI